MNDDTVIGVMPAARALAATTNVLIRLSDLDEPYQEAIRYADVERVRKANRLRRIAELEARLAKAEAALEAADAALEAHKLHAYTGNQLKARIRYRQALEAMNDE